MNHFIKTYDNALSESECNFVIDFINQSNLIRGKCGNGIVDLKSKDSNDFGMNLNHREGNYTTDNDTGNLYLKVNGIIFDALCKSIELYVKENPQLNDIAKWRYHPDYNLQKYFPNQAYHSSHCECDNLQHASRICAWMFYFNTIQDGGGTHFDSYDYTTNAVQGRCVIWPAYWTHFHHGIVSKTETKYIATGWINYVDSV